mmetsp:Transcript_16564/g.51550  ORF Transcript_16564/g.51550 Transcript_16564/m.51550 type:complete len:409 (+) Transcript_16564:61-1287(+)
MRAGMRALHACLITVEILQSTNAFVPNQPHTLRLRELKATDDYLSGLGSASAPLPASEAPLAAAKEFATVEAWREACAATGVVSFYDAGVRLTEELEAVVAAGPAKSSEPKLAAGPAKSGEPKLAAVSELEAATVAKIEAATGTEPEPAPVAGPTTAIEESRADKGTAVAGAAVIAATFAGLGLDADLAVLASIATAAFAVSDPTTSLGQLTRSVGRIASRALDAAKPAAADAISRLGDAAPDAPAARKPSSKPKLPAKPRLPATPRLPALPTLKNNALKLGEPEKKPAAPKAGIFDFLKATPPPPPRAGPFDFFKPADAPPPPPPAKKSPFDFFQSAPEPPAATTPEKKALFDFSPATTTTARPKPAAPVIPAALRKATGAARARAAEKSRAAADARKRKIDAARRK